MKKLHILITVFIGVFTMCSCSSKQQSSPTSATDSMQSQAIVKDISAEAAMEIFDKKDQEIIFIDVRTPEEIADGYMDNAQKIDYRNKDFKAQVLHLDKTKSYVVYCKSGGRSSRASEWMVDNGFIDVSNVLGGYSALSQLKTN